MRYLVATILGPEAPAVARIMTAALEAAGAPTGQLGPALEEISVSGSPLDDGLVAAAGTHAASAAYTLHETQPALGEMGRREATVLLGLIAFAQSGRRVGLLLDEAVAPEDPVHAPAPDLAVITRAPLDATRRALDLAPAGRPAVGAELTPDARDAAEDWATRTGSPLLLGGRDHEVRTETGGRLAFVIRGDPYVTFDPVPGADAVQLSCALAAVLALGTLGIRMREEWLLRGLDALRGRDAVAT